MTLDAVLYAAGAALILDGRTSRVILAYVTVAAAVALLTAPSTLGSPLPATLFLLGLTLKLAVVPIGLGLFVRRNAAARDLRPALPLPLRLIVILALGAGAQFVAQLPALAAIPQTAVASYIVLCGLAVLVIHRSLLAAVVGLLALSAGVALAGAMAAPGLPETVELGATFDALVVTFIGLALVRAFFTHHALLDSEALRSLRG
jgi:hydrogenase-4 membrane subunit HyfE